MSRKLEGKIAVVTGGSSGIGLATARRFVDEGAFVYITGRRQTELDKAAAQLGPNAVAVQSDASSLADIDRLFKKIGEEKGRIDVLFVNAGGAKFAPIGEVTEEHFDREFDINVKGLFFTVQSSLPLFNAGGTIILNASIVASKGMPNMSVYSATKAAVRSFARTWTTDLKGSGIRVNVVSPGPIDTPGLEGLTGDPEAMKAGMATGVPLGRVGDADEIAKAVVFLASDDSSFVAGTELFVDGGYAQV
ncbi:SDR family oxidoreductase [bacterium]|nr:MAG: SDR family oxidoreductase [bacterium]